MPCLTTFNIVGYINEIELNNLNVVFRQYATELHIELHLVCSVVCCILPCHALFKSDMHHTCLCIMPCVCGGCLLCCLFLSGLLLSLASVSFRSCEDSFDYLRLSSSWTRSSSLRDFRQDDHYPRNHFYLCLLVVRSFAMPRYLPLAISCLPYCHVKPLTHLS